MEKKKFRVTPKKLVKIIPKIQYSKKLNLSVENFSMTFENIKPFEKTINKKIK